MGALQNGMIHRAGPVKLGARLLAAAAMVRSGANVADIGCDHGKLSVYLVLSEKAKTVVAVDNRPLPLSRAQALAAHCQCGTRVQCRLGDGLAVLTAGEVDDIVIAGLSGETMVEILEPHAFVRSEDIRLVLVPTRRQALLRRWLYRQGFTLLQEMPLLERGRAYTVMQAAYTGQAYTPDDLFCEVGLVPKVPGPAAQAYLQMRLGDLAKQGRALQTEEEQARHEKLMKEIQACLQ